MKIKKLYGKFCRVCRDEGIGTAIGRSFHFLGNFDGRKKRRIDARNAKKHTGTVLFINGCCVEHPVRYRVLHQMEQLREAGIACENVFFEDLELCMEKNYQMFIFFRCEYTDETAAFAKLAKQHGKLVCFDIDDLITSTDYTDQIPFVQELPPLNRRLFDQTIRRIGRMLEESDVAIATTEALAEELGKTVPQIYVNRNVASKEMAACAEAAFAQKEEHAGDRVWIGYFSGSLTHNQDFEIIRSALMRILEEYPNVGLILVGELDVSDALVKYEDRIMRKHATGWRELPKLIVQADINLAPLEDTIFNRSKSEIKWIEAALVRVPTVASCVGAFEVMVESGVTGILCDNTENAWYTGLKRLVDDRKLRERIGQQAYQYVMAHCTTETSAERLADFVKRRLE